MRRGDAHWPDGQLGIDVIVVDDTTIVALEGHLEPFTAPGLEATVVAALEPEPAVVVLDLGRLRFIDASGIRVLLEMERVVRDTGASFLVRSPQENVIRLLEVLGLDQELTITADVAL